jgi:hypothetical protein
MIGQLTLMMLMPGQQPDIALALFIIVFFLYLFWLLFNA